MITKTIKYEDLDGNPVEDTFWFHMSKAELLAEAATGALQTQLERVGTGQADKAEILATFRDFLGKTVGERSEDGKRFIKSAEARSRFVDSDAYAAFLFELMSNPLGAADFIAGVLPNGMKAMSEEIAANGTDSPALQRLAAEWFNGGTPAAPAVDNTPVNVTDVADRDLTDWKTWDPNELIALDDQSWNLIVGPVKAGMDKQLIALAIRRGQLKSKGGA